MRRGSEHGNRYSPTGFDVLTHSGVMIDLRAPRADQVRLDDVAHSLAQQVRFTGHCPLNPTIAQHSLAVAYIAGKLLPDEIDPDIDPGPALRRVRLAALMHDGGEYLASDLAGAVKSLIRPRTHGGKPRAGAMSPFDHIEARAMAVVEERFDCAVVDEWRGLIHEADILACAYEMAWQGWCTAAVPPAWVTADPYVQRCYRSALPGAWPSGVCQNRPSDGGAAAFRRQALILGALPDDVYARRQEG